MKHYNKVTPEGTKDYIFDECTRKSHVTGSLKKIFKERGYRRVMTPTIEFYDVFGASADYLPQENMYKLMDNKGRLMVLCPDGTIPIARLSATRLLHMEMPLRLYYSHNVYRMANGLRGRSSEIYQCGVELIGSGSMRSDLEIMEMAAASLESISNGAGYRLELCHIGYFKALMDSLGADEETREEIRRNIEQKNFASLNDLLEQFPNNAAAAALKYLPRLFGGEEVFEQAYALFEDASARESLDYLRNIYNSLQQLGLGDKVIIDLGLVNQAEYYTGIIFRGYFNEVGEPVLSGGRYDNLLSDFGADFPAVGFAVNVDLASSIVEKHPPLTADVLVMASEDSYLVKAIQYRKQLIAKGQIVENCVLDDRAEAIRYAARCGIAQVHVIGKTTEIIDVEYEDIETTTEQVNV
ncbi:MAG: ATP phosphoribosyltransferase regulatory subunit [Peptococcaceae bacterium]|nr:ATP phosphoribosyltransferase regulatory subunit [Peptococcaceae bacterium]MBO5141320.1 ATP phosphoribosyltransferase regulatory subunit [Peptococcaceae bacterium]MBO5300981.1 ATP phosphoribosyltransferase regulatory subunit [Peptococcaceae bacterium]MBO5365019.1 ATP phosphoribosyltransferase regulatory subunit [Peptococcaceae bacterium]MBO5430277.1 ATP phosphoribosyltransferase regulatory subunit [Peptococcaceae bacterium]